MAINSSLSFRPRAGGNVAPSGVIDGGGVALNVTGRRSGVSKYWREVRSSRKKHKDIEITTNITLT